MKFTQHRRAVASQPRQTPTVYVWPCRRSQSPHCQRTSTSSGCRCQLVSLRDTQAPSPAKTANYMTLTCERGDRDVSKHERQKLQNALVTNERFGSSLFSNVHCSFFDNHIHSALSLLLFSPGITCAVVFCLPHLLPVCLVS